MTLAARSQDLVNFYRLTWGNGPGCLEPGLSQDRSRGGGGRLPRGVWGAGFPRRHLDHLNQLRQLDPEDIIEGGG